MAMTIKDFLHPSSKQEDFLFVLPKSFSRKSSEKAMLYTSLNPNINCIY